MAVLAGVAVLTTFLVQSASEAAHQTVFASGLDLQRRQTFVAPTTPIVMAALADANERDVAASEPVSIDRDAPRSPAADAQDIPSEQASLQQPPTVDEPAGASEPAEVPAAAAAKEVPAPNDRIDVAEKVLAEKVLDREPATTTLRPAPRPHATVVQPKVASVAVRHAHARPRLAQAEPTPAPSKAGFLFRAAFADGTDIVSEARRWLGTNPTTRTGLWCARFMNFVLERTGHPGSGSDLARSFSSYGHSVAGPRVGAIAVMARNGGGHVGVVSGIDENSNPIIISGNYSHTVMEATIPRGRIYAYVMP